MIEIIKFVFYILSTGLVFNILDNILIERLKIDIVKFQVSFQILVRLCAF